MTLYLRLHVTSVNSAFFGARKPFCNNDTHTNFGTLNVHLLTKHISSEQLVLPIHCKVTVAFITITRNLRFDTGRVTSTLLPETLQAVLL